MALFGPPNIDKLKSQENIGGLIKALGYSKDPEIVKAASTSLVELAPESIDPLIEAFTHKEIQIGKNAVETLVKIGMPALNDLLAGLYDYPTREKSIQVLKKLGDPAVNQAVNLVASWVKEEENLREEAIRILADLGPLAEGQLLSLLQDPATNEIIPPGNPMILTKQNIMEMIPNYNNLMKRTYDALQQGATLRQIVAGALGKAGGPDAVDPLITALEGKADFLRWVLFGSLYQIGSHHAMSFLNEHLEDDDMLLSGTGQVWLLLGDGVTIKRLLKVLLSDQEQASHSAAETLKELGSKLTGF